MSQKRFIVFSLLGIALIFSGISPVSAADSSSSVNLLRNAGFTQARAGWEVPDWWSGYIWWRSDWPEVWRISAEGWIPGTRSMKLINKTSDPVYLESNRYMPLVANRTYTLSAYLKSDKPETRVEFHIGAYGGVNPSIKKEFTVGTEWKRYSLTGKKEKDLSGAMLRIVLLDNATLMVNAPQLEEGETPTTWKLSPKDTAAVNKDGLAKTEAVVPKYPAPKIECPYVGKPPVIDGRLNDEAWKKAGKTVVFNQLDEAKPAAYPTEVFIGKDKDNLYIAFRCQEPELGKLVSKGTARDNTRIFSDDEVEVFISPRADGAGYLQFAVNTVGTQWEAKGNNSLWNTDWESRTGQETNAWTVELKIPFKSLQFSSGTKEDWRVNFARYRARPKTEEYSAWAPVISTFHDIKHYGLLKGISAEDVALAVQAPAGAALITYLDKSFYTDESKAEVFIDAPKGTKVEVTLNNRIEKGLLPESCLFRVDISALPLGDYPLKVKANEKEVTLTLKKLPPKPNQVKIDRVRRMLLVDEKPFIPISTTVAGTGSDLLRRLKDQADHGFNTATTSRPGGGPRGGYTDAYVRELLDSAQATGLKIIFWFWGDDKKDIQQWQADLLQIVEKFKDHPALLAWLVLDEVDDSGEWVIGMLDKVAAVDPYHPAYIDHREGWNEEKDKISGDFNSSYGYPICASDLPAGEAADFIRKEIKDITAYAQKKGKLVAYWHGIWGWAEAVREPTPLENQLVSYVSLIHGCRALSYYTYPPMSVPLWESFIGLSKEVQALTPAFYYGQEITDSVYCNNPAIDLAAFETDGKTYIVAVNIREWEEKAGFDLPGNSGNAEVLFEHRKLKVLKGKLKDTFKPLERHVYLIEAGGS